MKNRFDIPAVVECKRVLDNLQSTWDNLTLLCHLSGTGVNTGDTRVAFNDLTNSLFEKLSAEIIKKTVFSITSKCQSSIDILTRNLFERTADIGFICKDPSISEFFSCPDEGVTQSLGSYLDLYMKTYSVYSHAALVDVSGSTLLHRTRTPGADVGNLKLSFAITQKIQAGSIEFFEDIGLGDHSLFYASPVYRQSNLVGYIVLVFDHVDELERIFESELTPDNWAVIAFIDQNDRIILSSDPYHVQKGMRLKASSEFSVSRIGVHEYVGITREASPFQGYAGNGWRAHVLVSVNRAFDDVTSALSVGQIDTSMLFDDEIKGIPVKSSEIQKSLNRSVWNGSIHQSRDSSNSSFSKILLKEIGDTGQKTRDAFSGSISRLSNTIVSSVLESVHVSANLAMNILDRSLYERANDCRWWTRNPVFLDREPGYQERLRDELSRLNDLYTVYTNIVLFNKDGSVVATSRECSMTQISKDWVQRCCSGSDYSYHVSDWDDSLNGHEGYVYTSPIFKDGVCVGGIALYFDTVNQLESILRDVSLSRTGSFAVFVDRKGVIIASSGGPFKAGDVFDLSSVKDNIYNAEDRFYVVGTAQPAGYREYRAYGHSADVVVLSLAQVGSPVKDLGAHKHPAIMSVGSETSKSDVATFRCGSTWYSMMSSDVVESVTSRGLTSSPGAGNLFYLMYGKHAIPVFNMPANEGRPAGPEVVIAKSGEVKFGLLVDEVGSVFEVPSSQIKEIPNMFNKATMLNSHVLHTQNDKNDLIMVLDAEKLAQRLGCSGVVLEKEPSPSDLLLGLNRAA